MQRETDSEQVPWGKDEKNFEKRVKKDLKSLTGKRWKSIDQIKKSRICSKLENENFSKVSVYSVSLKVWKIF